MFIELSFELYLRDRVKLIFNIQKLFINHQFNLRINYIHRHYVKAWLTRLREFSSIDINNA